LALLDSIIATACIGLSGQGHDACVKGLQAGSQQTGVQQSVNSYESKQTKMLEQTAYNWVGKDSASVVGGVAFVGKAAVDKKASLGLPNLGICSKMSLEVGSKASQLLLKWSF
jgi:hypothetical protein